jgi:acetoin utilization deacetylase AcuC-like enzyme
VNDLSKEIEKQANTASTPSGSNPAGAPIVPFTPAVQKKQNMEVTKKNGHSDTSFSAGSLKAARRAAGAVKHAVDRVLLGRNRNAFCVVRPPGHHAGIGGLLEGAESCGFCIFNNVAAGALYALSEHHSPRCQKVAIIDIDVHHGNGTEEVRARAQAKRAQK